MLGLSKPLIFRCRNAELVGVVEQPENPGSVGILIVTGGPQYRVGSHREFVHLSRAFAQAGFPTMRFDYRGMGDSGGSPVSFDASMDDIRSAVDALFSCTSIDSVALWGLCDGASAALIYAPTDTRVSALMLANPWVRTETGLARTYLSRYYVQRFLSRSFWRKVVRGRMKPIKAGKDLMRTAKSALGMSFEQPRSTSQSKEDFRVRMQDGLRKFDGPVSVMLSTNDLTAAEFETYVNGSRSWRRLIRKKKVQLERLQGMDHTFSTSAWKSRVADRSISWLMSNRPPSQSWVAADDSRSG